MKTEIALVWISGEIIETVESITFILRTFYARVSNIITEVSVYFLSWITLAITKPLSFNQLITSYSICNNGAGSVTDINFWRSLACVKAVE